MSTKDPDLGTAARRRIVQHWRRAAEPWCQHPRCRWPEVPIDYGAAPGSPYALDVDEVVPRCEGGRADVLSNTRPTHAECNRAEGGRMSQRSRGVGVAPLTSREWW